MYLLAANFRTIFTHNGLHGGQDLLSDGRRDGRCIAMGMAVGAEEVDQFLERKMN